MPSTTSMPNLFSSIGLRASKSIGQLAVSIASLTQVPRCSTSIDRSRPFVISFSNFTRGTVCRQWGIWLEETLLADVPHRQVVFTVPKRLRPYFLYDRKLLGELSRVAASTVTSFIRATVGEKGLSVGIVSSIQTHGSLANWHPHLHL